MNSEIIKSRMVVLTGKENTDVTDTDMAIYELDDVGWCKPLLEHWWSKGREKYDMA
jgi:hypothetical protein